MKSKCCILVSYVKATEDPINEESQRMCIESTHLSKSEAHLYPFEWTLRMHGCHPHHPPHLDSTDYLLHLNVEGGQSLTNGEKMSFL